LFSYKNHIDSDSNENQNLNETGFYGLTIKDFSKGLVFKGFLTT
jgi:hypothetical protein